MNRALALREWTGTILLAVLVDLGRCGVADDQFIVLQPLLNLSRDGLLPGDEIRAENGPGEAKLITRAQRDGLLLETSFLVDREQARRLRVVSRVSRVGKGPALHAFGDVAVHSDRALQPFTLSLADPEKSRGFAHPAVDLDGALSVARAAHAGDLHVLVGADGIRQEPARFRPGAGGSLLFGLRGVLTAVLVEAAATPRCVAAGAAPAHGSRAGRDAAGRAGALGGRSVRRGLGHRRAVRRRASGIGPRERRRGPSPRRSRGRRSDDRGASQRRW